MKLSTRAVIPVALAIPLAPSQSRPRPSAANDSSPVEPEERERVSANCPNYWL
ncbi:hypothetical protein ACNOYE_21640 [Nannocystaceae bacterium ST9]